MRVNSISCFEIQFWSTLVEVRAILKKKCLHQRPGSGRNNSDSCLENSSKCFQRRGQCLWVPLISKEGPADYVTIAKVPDLCCFILERLVVRNNTGTEETYIGLASKFKSRFYKHKASMEKLPHISGRKQRKADTQKWKKHPNLQSHSSH